MREFKLENFCVVKNNKEAIKENSTDLPNLYILDCAFYLCQSSKNCVCFK